VKPTLGLTVLGLLLVLGACAAQPGAQSASQPAVPSHDPALLTGERLFGAPLDPALMPRVDVLGLNEAMRAFVRAHTEGDRLAATRLRDLTEALLAAGYFGETRYNPRETLTAAEAFRTRNGNCLSFTNLFVAMAREADLDAVYQIVEVPPSFDADSGFLIRYTHINVLLRGLRLQKALNEVVVVDFNVIQPDGDHPRREVSDDYAAALYYANHAIERLRNNKVHDAFAYLRRAIELAPRNPDLWVNLGALYGSQDDFNSAVEAYDVAVALDPFNRTALAGLARSHRSLGNVARAEAFDARARKYLESNAYFHLANAQAAYLRGEFEPALASVNRALALERRSGRFWFVKGLIEERMGAVDDARQSYRLARRYGVSSPQKRERLRIGRTT